MAFLIVNKIENEEKLFKELFKLGIYVPMHNFRVGPKYILAILRFDNVVDFTKERNDLVEFPIVPETWFRTKILNTKDPVKELRKLTKVVGSKSFQCLFDYASYIYHKNKKDGVTNN